MYQRMFEGNVDFNKVDANWQKELVSRIAAAGSTKEEMIAVLNDLVVVNSKSINDTIDAAKNPNLVEVPYMEEIDNKVRSGAVATTDYTKIKLLPGRLALDAIELSVRGAKDEMKPKDRCKFCGRPVRQEVKGKNKVLVIEDLLTSLRNETAIYAYRKLDEKIKSSMSNELMAYQTQDVRLHNSLKFLASRYDDAMHIDNGDKKGMKKAIVRMSRNLIRNYSHADVRSLYKEAFLASRYKDVKTGAEMTNSFYMAFTSEAAEYFVNRYNPNGTFENRVYKFGGGKAKVGQHITFVNGISEDGFYTETKVNGAYTLGINNDIQAVVRKPIRNMIPEAQYDDHAVFMELKPNQSQKIEDMAALIERARASNANFSVVYRNRITKKVQKTPADSDLWLYANHTPIAALYNAMNHGGISHYESFLANKDMSVDQIEIFISNKAGKRNHVFVLGHTK